jgi:hypothetical protein
MQIKTGVSPPYSRQALNSLINYFMKKTISFILFTILTLRLSAQCSAVVTATQLESCIESVPTNGSNTITLAANINLTGVLITVPNGAQINLILNNYNIVWNASVTAWEFANPGVTTTLNLSQNGGTGLAVVKNSATTNQQTVANFQASGNAQNVLALPVELKDFTTKVLGQTVILSFSTASEINNALFEVERSLDGFVFEKIGEKAGAGNTRTEQYYSFEDVTPLPGTNYYRLRQVDTDGKATYSPVRSVVLNGTPTIGIYPNPVSESMNITLSEAFDTDGQWEMLDFSGRTVQTGTFAAEQNTQTIVVSNLLPGNYVLRLTFGNVVTHTRFVK